MDLHLWGQKLHLAVFTLVSLEMPLKVSIIIISFDKCKSNNAKS